MREHLKFYIDGAWVDPVQPRAHDVINPATEEPVAKISLGSAADVDKAREAGATTDAEVGQYVVRQLRSGALKFSVEDPDGEENWPRVWIIWRGGRVQSRPKASWAQPVIGRHFSCPT